MRPQVLVQATLKIKALKHSSLARNHLRLCFHVSLSLGLTEKEKSFLANREKGKGNEAFYSGDYEEAVMYYTRSVGSPFLWLRFALLGTGE